MVFRLLLDLGWVDLDFPVPPCCLAAQPILPNLHQPKQNWAGSGTPTIQASPTQPKSQSRWNTLYC